MNLDKAIFDEVINSHKEGFELASYISEWVRERMLPETIWYCQKFNTTIARKHGRSKCAARVNKETDFHSAKSFDCGEVVLVKIF